MVQPPTAPTQTIVALRGNYEVATADYRVPQNYSYYAPDEQAIWRELYARQLKLLPEYAAPEFVAGLARLQASAEQIPRLEEVSERLQQLTGWYVIGVPGLIPEDVFFAHLAARRFPVTVWMRRREELDYLVEPDLFHDFFGHLPMLAHPVFADYVQAYGVLGTRAPHPGALKMLARLYWYTVEFGLIKSDAELHAYGAGILSSSGETVFAIRGANPQRVAFDLQTVLRTDYLIDAFQKTYFVLGSFDELFDSVLGADFGALFAAWSDVPGFAPGAVPLSSSAAWQRDTMVQGAVG